MQSRAGDLESPCLSNNGSHASDKYLLDRAPSFPTIGYSYDENQLPYFTDTQIFNSTGAHLLNVVY